LAKFSTARSTSAAACQSTVQDRVPAWLAACASTLCAESGTDSCQDRDQGRGNVPSICEAKALASLLFTVELAPRSKLLGGPPPLYTLWPVPEREGGWGCSHDDWRPGAGEGQLGSL
jgi:hypothetical protein